MDGSAFGSGGGNVQQRLCKSNEAATPLSGDTKYDNAWNDNLLCAEELPGPWVTVVLRPMTMTNLEGGKFIASQKPKDMRQSTGLTGGGNDSDNPTSITKPTSPRFLVLSELAVCES